MITITKNFDCSTGHITKEDDEKIKASVKSPIADLIAYCYDEGYFIYVGEDDMDDLATRAGYSSAFVILLGVARRNGCKYLQLDCDGTTYEEYPTFKW